MVKVGGAQTRVPFVYKNPFCPRIGLNIGMHKSAKPLTPDITWLHGHFVIGLNSSFFRGLGHETQFD